MVMFQRMEERVFSSNPRDYNRVTCAACTSVVKVHHLRRHLQNHGLRCPSPAQALFLD